MLYKVKINSLHKDGFHEHFSPIFADSQKAIDAFKFIADQEYKSWKSGFVINSLVTLVKLVENGTNNVYLAGAFEGEYIETDDEPIAFQQIDSRAQFINTPHENLIRVGIPYLDD